MNSASQIRETLRYAKRFSGQVFVVRLDTTKRLDVRLIDDIRILLALGIRFAFICGEDSGARTDLDSVTATCDLESVGVREVVLREDAVTMLYGRMDSNIVDELTLKLALALKASKLFFMTSSDGIHGENGLIREMDVEQAKNLLDGTKISARGIMHPLLGSSMRARLSLAIRACIEGIHRVHFLSASRDGSLLEELFLADGSGTMVYQQRNGYAVIRKAFSGDLPELLRLLSEAHVTDYAQHDIEKLLDDVFVRAVDERLSGCIMATVSDTTATLRFAAASGENISGILAELVEHAYRHCVDRGALEVELHGPNQDWLNINPVLGRLGFTQSESDKLWRVTVI